LDKAIQIPKYFVSLQCFRNNAEAQGWRLRDGNLYIGKALLDALRDIGTGPEVNPMILYYLL